MTKYELVETGILAKGKKELLKYLEGKSLSRKEAIMAMCYECMGYYIDGKEDCEIPECPLFQYMPYSNK